MFKVKKMKILMFISYFVGACMIVFALSILFSNSLQQEIVKTIAAYKNKSPDFMYNGLPVSYYWLVLLKNIARVMLFSGFFVVLLVRFRSAVLGSSKRLANFFKNDAFEAEDKIISFFKSHFVPLLVIIISLYLIMSFINIVFAKSWLDEGKYYMKGYWWVTGIIKPYTADDGVLYMPFTFYLFGFWQLLFGKGLIVSRVLPAIVGLGCFYMVFKVGKELFKTNWKIKSLLVIYIYVLTPMALFYTVAVGVYSVVTFISLVILYIILNDKKFNVWLFCFLVGGLFYTLHFFRPNMLVGIACFSLYILFKCKEKRFIKFFGSIALYLLFSIITLQLFPPLLTYISFRLPIISDIARLIPGFPDPFPLAVENRDFIKNEVLAGEAFYNFNRYFFKNYFHVFMMSLVFVITLYRKKRVNWAIIFCLFYFIVQIIVHFVGSQSYCGSCIQAYTNYFYIFGCIVAVSAFKPLFFGFKKSLIMRALICCFIVVSAFYSFKNINYSISNFGNSYASQVATLASEIDEVVPENEKMLVIGGVPLGTQAVFQSGRRMEITSINQNYCYIKIKGGLSESELKATMEQMKLVPFWSDEVMEEWLVFEYDYILAAHEWTREPDIKSFYERYYDSITTHFTLLRKVKVGGKEYYIYKRKDIDR